MQNSKQTDIDVGLHVPRRTLLVVTNLHVEDRVQRISKVKCNTIQSAYTKYRH